VLFFFCPTIPLGRYVAHLLEHILGSPNDEFQKILDDAKRAAGWDRATRPLLSLHVRHGDTCSAMQEERTARRCEPLSVYMRTAVIPMTRRYNISSIYLATDDEKVIADTQRYPKFQWLFLPSTIMDRNEAVRNVNMDELLRKRDFDHYTEGQNAVIDMLLLSEGDAYVGKFTSNIDRISFALLAAKHNSLVPYKSMDSTWCMDWGKPAGVSTFGNYHC